MITGKGLYATLISVCLLTRPVSNHFAITGAIKPVDALIFQAVAAFIMVMVLLFLLDEAIKAIRGEPEAE